jgi:hypothetical protein
MNYDVGVVTQRLRISPDGSFALAIGGSAPGGGAWYDLYSVTLTTDNPGWDNYTIRQKVLSTHYAGGVPATGTKLRATMVAGGGGIVWGGLFIGHGATATGSATDFDGSQLPWLVSGSGSGSLASNATVVTDELNFSWVKTKSTIASIGFTLTPAVSDVKSLTPAASTLIGGWSLRAGSHDEGNNVADGTQDIASRVYLFAKIEVFG